MKRVDDSIKHLQAGPQGARVTAPKTPWGAAIDRVLADGEWHDREEILAAGVLTVPPGVAYRHAERLRRVYAAGPRKRGDDSTAVAAGARDKVRRVLAAHVQRGTVERDGNHFRRRSW